MRSVLVANRGEIALRVFRTAKQMGLRTIALYTDLDAGAPHVRAADVVVRVPSYLDVEAVVDAAVSSGADVVHPGYGFLSERSAFATALEDKGVALAGPSAAVMERMGRKDAAREVAVAAGVPVVPSYSLDEDPATFRYPVLVKAAAGGGGKGMRVCRSAAELPDALAAARREAAGAFGDDTMLVETYVESGRHLEVQVIGDSHGTVLHLWERDCSTQRRHQKVLEEAPAPTIDAETRARLTSSAVALAQEVGYVGAGTVEYLLDAATGEFYFLEMNTRLQVEHPVTEAITGLDLVELQLRVAAGEPLPLAQEDVPSNGHAIEARVYAEDAFGGFLPQAGTATLVQWPSAPGVRVDHALESGQVVSTSYDPMLGKVIVHGTDREAARLGLVAALDHTAVLGLTTNTGFLRALTASDEFRDATIDTAWLDHHEVPAPDPAPARLAAAWAWFDAHRTSHGPFASDGFRLGAEPSPLLVTLDEDVVLDAPAPPGATTLVRGDRVEVVHQGQRFVFIRPDLAADQGTGAGDRSIVAPMPGTVLEVRVTEGQQVAEGDVLGVLEAMKMEVALRSPHAGTVVSVGAAAGDQVVLGARLFEVEPEADGED
ncbi:carbamoyl-phosphate synthase subunit L [Nocardioides gansuensis]|uniref:Carbamoyl-phosphate synthase subunit L n=1 Tax=Nocardioides gansuensis TaxID=2138300 RepID=A0A2T8F8A9_9ACTN|nr:biotin carboxylase N-terminal domain-containing protein [Nocardioides gansuensis]PVG81954.1 carbamoyl-phosphate synthase subunit L [Nocardioides gansuensis]